MNRGVWEARRLLAVLPAVAALLVAAGIARGQPAPPADEWAGAVEAKVQELGASDAVLGKRIFVDAKAVAVSGSEVVARDTDVLFVLDAAALSTIQSLREGQNFRAFGVVTRDAAGRRTFAVRRLDRRADDPALFREELERLRAGGDKAAIFALAARIDAEVAQSKGNAALRGIVADAYRAAIALEEKVWKADDVAQAIRIADLYAQKLGDRQLALEWLGRTFGAGTYPPPEIDKRLRAINAVPYAGQWVLYEEMKRREGFVQRGETWVPIEHAQFLEAVDDQVRAPRRERVTAIQEAFVEAARHGQVMLGMLKREVASAIGFPDGVDRVRRTVETRQHVFDAWHYEGRGIYVFEDDILFRKP